MISYNILNYIIFTRPFFIGVGVGAILLLIYFRQKAKWISRHNSDRRQIISHVSRVWLAGLALALSLGYMLLTNQRNRIETASLHDNVVSCWTENYNQAKIQIEINTQNDQLNQRTLELQRDYDRITSELIKSILLPPPEIANLGLENPLRLAWKNEVSKIYQRQIDDLGNKADDVITQRNQLNLKRSQNPLPEAKCGKQ